MNIFASIKTKLARAHLQTKIILAFILPIMAVILFNSYYHMSKEWNDILQLSEIHISELGQLTLSSLDHAMLSNDRMMISEILGSVEESENVNRARIIDYTGLLTDKNGSQQYAVHSDDICLDCLFEDDAPSASAEAITIDGEQIFRSITPIENRPACQECHSADPSYLGVLVIDNRLEDVGQRLREDLWESIFFTFLALGFIGILAFYLINWLIESRISTIDSALRSFAAGDFSSRVNIKWNTSDEITNLAETFNDMAGALERYDQERIEIEQVRQQAIIDEREWIARDLHDGVAQILGYLVTKTSAIILLVKQNELEKAQQELAEMAQMIDSGNEDVRSAISSIRCVSVEGSTLAESLDILANRCLQLFTVDLKLEIGANAELVRFGPEEEYHLLRIAQEALNNAQKHANASQITITFDVAGDAVVLMVADDGKGFNPWHQTHWQYPHFGLASMSERAEKIDADFSIHTNTGEGTKIKVVKKLKGQDYEEDSGS